MVCGENWNEIVNIQKLSLSSRRDWSNQSHLFVGELDKESQKVSCCEPAVPQNRLSNIWEIFRYFQNLKEIRNKIQENNRASIWKTISIKCNFSLFLRSKPLFSFFIILSTEVGEEFYWVRWMVKVVSQLISKNLWKFGDWWSRLNQWISQFLSQGSFGYQERKFCFITVADMNLCSQKMIRKIQICSIPSSR